MEILGIDVGGTGIKGAPVDVEKGVLLAQRYRLRTPRSGKPLPMAKKAAEITRYFAWQGPIGLGFPAVVQHGVTKTAANVHPTWIDADAAALFSEATGCPVVVLNDADAAGLAEMAFGAGRERAGVVLVVTLGTGIGSALFSDGRLLPNTELGHLVIDGYEAELRASDAARKRDARPMAELLGAGTSCDAHHMTAAHPEGEGAVRAMASALRESNRGTQDVDYISAHGTGTPTNDRVESIAVRTLFGERAPKVPLSSIKSMIGHTMGAASAIEAAACALALDTGMIPPTINFEEPDPEFDLDYVPNEARRTNPRVALNNAYAFGGNNASLCLARWQL